MSAHVFLDIQFRQEEIDAGQSQYDHEENPGHGRGISETGNRHVESGHEHIDRKQKRRIGRPSLGRLPITKASEKAL
jgi:hypothetical protein